jgi:OOP family OmpA-OmpF porin
MKRLFFIGMSVIIATVFSKNSVSEPYIGGKVGYNVLSNSCHLSESCNDRSLAISSHLGYNFTEYVSVELTTDYLGKYIVFDNLSSNSTTLSSLAISLAPKFNFPIDRDWNLFVKMGGAYMINSHENIIVPTGSLGVEYHITDRMSIRAEYQRYQGMSNTFAYDMDGNFLGIGFNYAFDFNSVAEEVVAEEVVAEEVVAEEVVAEEVVAEEVVAES